MVAERRQGSILIQGGHIIDPSQRIDAVGDVYIAEGKIVWLSTVGIADASEECAVIRAEGMVVCPGFIDVHCHLRQPGFEEKETIVTGTKAAARGGYTTVCCMPNTNPPVDNGSMIEYIKDIASTEGLVRVLPIGCITKGREGRELADFGELAASGAVACSDDGSPVADYDVMRHALEATRNLGLPIIDHCEDLTRSQDGVMNQGALATRLGLKGIPPAAEDDVVARDIELARLTGGKLHVAHVSTAGSVGLIREAKKEGVSVTAEATPHHLTLTEELVAGYKTNAKVKPPLRTAEDVAELIEGLNEGVIDVIATDHAPHTAQDKMCDFTQAAFGISGFETALGSLMGLVHQGKVDLVTLISKLTYEPASFLGQNALGTLKSGAVADVTIFNPQLHWVVNPEEFASKGKNTPLTGFVMKGKVVVTIVGGVVVYMDDSVKTDIVVQP